MKIVYGHSAGAWLELNTGGHARTRYELLEVSTHALRYDPAGAPMPRVGAPVAGLVRLAHGVELVIRGSVDRVQDGEVTLRIERGGPSVEVLAAEQIEVRKRS